MSVGFLYKVVFIDPVVLKYVIVSRISRNGSSFNEKSISSWIE